MIKRHDRANGQQGFTLIEIIAALVILGILAAVAVPKYQELQHSGADRAIEMALGTGCSQANLVYNNQVNNGAADPLDAAVTYLAANSLTLNDFTYTYAKSGTTGITVTLTGGVAGTPGAKSWTMKTAGDSAVPVAKTIVLQ